MTATDPTSTPAPASAEPDIMALALAADRGETIPETPTEQTTTPTPAAGTTDKAADTAETAQPDTTAPETTAQTTPPAKPESAFEKAKKEKARREVTWEKINQEKAELAAQRSRLQRDAEELARMAQTVRTPPQPAPTPASPYSAEQYEQAAERLDGEGKFDLADAARAEARRQRTQPPAAAQRPQVPHQQPQAEAMVPGSPQFTTAWKQTLAELTTLDPDLARPDAAIFKATAEALKKDPALNQRPNGIAYAYHRALKTIAGSTSEELTKAKTELDRLNKHSALRGSPPGAVTTTTKRIEDMTPAEADAYVLSMAQAADRGEL